MCGQSRSLCYNIARTVSILITYLLRGAHVVKESELDDVLQTNVFSTCTRTYVLYVIECVSVEQSLFYFAKSYRFKSSVLTSYKEIILSLMEFVPLVL